METRISVLPKDIADKIAAGEVVERPASIVKELLENAVDAEATDIVIELEEGGKASIRITDNGAGIDPRDVETAFERHATSKIATLEDMYRIRSFGFRGEALPSIAAIADVELMTRRRGDLSGVRVRVEGGHLIEAASAGCPEGTTFLVRNIFHAIPARKKFLKKDAIEQSYCLDVITRIALAYPDIRITVNQNGKTLFKAPKTRDMAERIALILGADFNKRILPVEGTHDGVRLHGYISRPDFTRTSSKSIFLYVNGRSVRDALITSAVMNAYRGQLEPRKYPAVVLFVDVAPEEVDVNVHPAKTEVRFRESKKVYETVLETLAVALSRSLLSATSTAEPSRPSPSFSQSSGSSFSQPSFSRSGRSDYAVKENPYRYFISTGAAKPVYQPVPEVPPARPEPMALPVGPASAASDAAAETEGFLSSRDYLGQVGGTYLVFAKADGLVLVDQHAAHERIRYERLKEADARHSLPSQMLLLPEVIALSPSECALMAEFEEVFQRIGMEITVLGQDSVAVKSMPDFISTDVATVIRDMLAEVADLGKTHAPDLIKEKIFASLACKGAVKAHDRLTEREVIALCEDLNRIPNAATCPHGRPVYVQFAMKDLERLFKRT